MCAGERRGENDKLAVALATKRLHVHVLLQSLHAQEIGLP